MRKPNIPTGRWQMRKHCFLLGTAFVLLLSLPFVFQRTALADGGWVQKLSFDKEDNNTWHIDVSSTVTHVLQCDGLFDAIRLTDNKHITGGRISFKVPAYTGKGPAVIAGWRAISYSNFTYTMICK